MRLNNKGMAISGILYSILVLFLVLLFGILAIVGSTKFTYDNLKNDIVDKLNSEVIIDDGVIEGESIRLSNDMNNNGEADIGDIITVRSKMNTNEKFYVISNDGTNVVALAKYNLKVGRIYTANSTFTEIASTEKGYGLQNEEMIGSPSTGEYPYKGTTAFSNSSNNYSGSIIEQYVNAYKNKLSNKVIEVRLITKEELVALGCNESSYTCSGAPTFVSETSYWSGSAPAVYIYCVWYVNSTGYFGFTEYEIARDSGVRPVITILKSEL